MDTTPIFPTFKNIRIADKEIFDNFSKFTLYSDFNLLSLLSWNIGETNSYSMLNDNMVLKVKDYLSEGYNYSIIGENDIETCIDMLLKEFETLKFVPETVIDKIENKNKYVLTEDRDNFDYIISIPKIINTEGNEMKPLRRHIQKFEEKFKEYEIKLVDHKDSSVQTSIIELTKTWVQQKNFEADKLAEEIKITQNFLEYAPKFNCDLLTLSVNNKLAAYTFNEIINTEMVMGHFGKALGEYTSAAYFMEWQTAKYYLERGFKEINQEQDTGIEGLRTYKLTFKPTRFLKKYVITKAKPN